MTLIEKIRSPATLSVPVPSRKCADMGINPCGDCERVLLTDTPSPYTYVERSSHELFRDASAITLIPLSTIKEFS